MFFLDALKLQLSKKRWDRIDKMLRVQSRVFSMSDAVITRIEIEAIKWMRMVECLEELRMTYDRSRSSNGVPFQRSMPKSILKKAMVNQGLAYEDDQCPDELRELLGTLFVNGVVEKEQKGLHPCLKLLSASLRGDLAEVKRLLAAGERTWVKKTNACCDHKDIRSLQFSVR